MISNNLGGMASPGGIVSRNAAGMVASGMGTPNTGSLINNQVPGMPRYLGNQYDFSGTTVPNFYQINPQKFPFYQMRNQMDQGLYTPGAPTFTGVNVQQPNNFAGVSLPTGNQLYAINPGSTGYSNNPVAQELLRRSYNPTPAGAMPNAQNFATRQEYNQAMRNYANAMSAAGQPLMAYYNPRYSAPNVSLNQGGLLGYRP